MRLINHLNEARTPLLEIVQSLYTNSKDYVLYFKKNGAQSFLYSGRKDKRYLFIKDVRKGRKSAQTPQPISDAFDDHFKKKYGWKPRSEALFVTGATSQASAYGNNVYMIFPIGKVKFLWSPTIKDLWTEKLYYSDILVAHEKRQPSKYEIMDAKMNIIASLQKDYMEKNPLPDKDVFLMKKDMARETKKWENNLDKTFGKGEVKKRLQQWQDKRQADLEAKADADIKELVSTQYTDKDLNKAIRSGNEIMLKADKYVAVNIDYEMMLQGFIDWFDWYSQPTQQDMQDYAEEYNIPNKRSILWSK